MALDGGWFGSEAQARDQYNRGRVDGERLGANNGYKDGYEAGCKETYAATVNKANYIINDLNVKYEASQAKLTISTQKTLAMQTELDALRLQLAKLQQENIALTNKQAKTQVVQNANAATMTQLTAFKNAFTKINSAYDAYLNTPRADRNGETFERYLHNTFSRGSAQIAISETEKNIPEIQKFTGTLNEFRTRETKYLQWKQEQAIQQEKALSGEIIC